MDVTEQTGLAGTVGLHVYVITEVVKRITGWTDRRALVVAAVTALLLAALVVFAAHSGLIATAWTLIQSWIGGLATAIGAYKFPQRNGGADGR
ncbi:MAG: hypothetical protein NZ761_10935 [Dehalococcoidia bacterium]|nr:hypothetical protein [Dehalococcoidia bacterium]